MFVGESEGRKSSNWWCGKQGDLKPSGWALDLIWLGQSRPALLNGSVMLC
jgi:hypothetical protein